MLNEILSINQKFVITFKQNKLASLNKHTYIVTVKLKISFEMYEKSTYFNHDFTYLYFYII